MYIKIVARKILYSFDFELDDFQKDALEKIDSGKSVVVCAPTGAGNTCIAEFAIQKAIKKNERIFYTTPLKALSNQKYSDFKKKYGSENVGLLTGDSSFNREAKIVIMTTEVFRNMLYGTHFGCVKDNLKNVKYVVLDEVHYMNDEQRGTVWEESIIYCPTDIQIIALSATIKNSKQLADWINNVHSKTSVVFTDYRPVPLRFSYFDAINTQKLFPLFNSKNQLNSKIPISNNKPSKKRKKNSQVLNLLKILYEKNMLPAIYFTFSRKKCDEQMEKCANLNLVDKDQKKEIESIIEEYIIENPHLYGNDQIKYLLKGVGSHHAGILPSLKELIEKLFQMGLLKVVFATETLAAGINMPARTTVISAISKRTDSGHRILTSNEFLQMSGRAGRRGMDEVGYVVVVGNQFESVQSVAKLASSPSDPLVSKFSPGFSMVTNLLQRFSLDEAKELILKSFGYFTSNERLYPLICCQNELEDEIEKIKNYPCAFSHTNQDLIEFKKTKEQFHNWLKVAKSLKKDMKENDAETLDQLKKTCQTVEKFKEKMKKYGCFNSKCYKKHNKSLELLLRLEKREQALKKQIDYERDIFWQKFLNHKNLLEETGYIEDNYPTEKGKIVSVLRCENELYLSEIILSSVLNNLEPREIASCLCAVITEDVRNAAACYEPISRKTRIALTRIKDIKQRILKLQEKHSIQAPVLLNSYYCPFIEAWVDGKTWEEILKFAPVAQGDLVRIFKRTVDILKQICLLPFADENLKSRCSSAFESILKDPVDIC